MNCIYEFLDYNLSFLSKALFFVTSFLQSSHLKLEGSCNMYFKFLPQNKLFILNHKLEFTYNMNLKFL